MTTEGRFSALTSRLARFFAGRVPVRQLEISPRPPQVTKLNALRALPSISRLCLEPRVRKARCLEWSRLAVKTSAIGALRCEAACRHVPFAGKEATVRQGVRPFSVTGRKFDEKRLRALPQERSNRVRYLGDRWRPQGASVLALFSPIIKDSLFKSALDKRTGSLLCWMDPASRATDPFSLLLLRRRDAKDQPLEWLWFPLSGE